MSGELNERVKSFFLPPPIDGLDLVSSPAQIGVTNARELTNFWCYDSGIRQIPDAALNTNLSYSGANSNVQVLACDDSILFYTTQLKLYKITSATATSATDVTGACVITQTVWNPCIFNKRLFLFNGTDTPVTHDFGAGNFAACTMTGPTITTLKQACSYKSRMYAVKTLSNSIWYSPSAGNFAGLFVELDLSDVWTKAGSQILCVFPWSFNQGNTNERLFVVLSNKGEVLVYSGDYPAAANWQLVVQTNMPAPSTADSALTGMPFAEVPNDVLVMTERGIVPMSSVVAGRGVEDAQFNVSRKIKNQVDGNIARPIMVDRKRPFLYARTTANFSQFHVMNYERGAWSKYTPTLASTHLIIGALFFGDYMVIGSGVAGGTAGNVYNVPLTGAAASTLTYTWKTSFLNFGKAIQKTIAFIRVLGLNVTNSSVFKITTYIASEFLDPSSPLTTTNSTSVAADTNAVLDVAPNGGLGRWLSFCFSRAGVDSINERNEIQGCDIYYQEGGGM